MTAGPSPADPVAIEVLLARLQADFLGELDERIDQIENLTLAFEKGGFNQVDFDALYRTVHSLKGTAGSFGFSILSAVCHAFEDYLNANKQQDRQFLNNCLGYIDLLRLACDRIHRKQTDFTEIEASIRKLRERHFAKRFTAMLVETSKTNAQLCQQALTGLPIQIVQLDDGLQALTRLLSEPFDLLITSQEVKTLNGMALISAIRLAGRAGQPIKSILLTSQPGIIPAAIQPDHIVHKDQHLDRNLAVAVSQALGLTT